MTNDSHSQAFSLHCLEYFLGGDLQFRTPPLPGCWILFLCTFYAEYVHPLHFFLFFCRCNIDPDWCRLLSLFSAVTAKRSLHSLAFCLFPKVNYSLILFQLLSLWIFSAFVYRLILLSSLTTELKFKAKSEIIPIALNYHAIFGIVVLYNYFIVFSLLSIQATSCFHMILPQHWNLSLLSQCCLFV